MKKTKYIILIILTCILSIFLYNNYNNIKEYILHVNRVDTVFYTDTVWKLDSVEIIKPVPKYIEKIRIDTVYDKNDNPIEIITENKKYQDTITTCAGDTMAVTSYISGINATLDSLKVNLSKQEITKTEIITKYITPKKKFIDHFKIGVGVGYGLGLTNKNFEPFVGFSLNYNF